MTVSSFQYGTVTSASGLKAKQCQTFGTESVSVFVCAFFLGKLSSRPLQSYGWIIANTKTIRYDYVFVEQRLCYACYTVSGVVL